MERRGAGGGAGIWQIVLLAGFVPWHRPAAVEAAGPVAAARESRAADDLDRQPSWSPPDYGSLRGRMLVWIDAWRGPADLPADVRSQARGLWPVETEAADPFALDPVGRVVRSIALLDPRVARLEQDPLAPSDWLSDPGIDALQRETLTLWLGRELARRDRFDDALALLAGLEVRSSVDPATLLFFRAVCQHWLLESDAAVETIDRLLERADAIPVRYERLARLMRADLTGLEDESLDHISRRMRDITRRLGQGRAGPRTRGVQDGVIESLDKLIAAIEKSQQQCQNGGAGGGGSGQGGQGKPMDDSRLADGKGPGEVTRRDIGSADGWGNLPPHQREEALQQIGREFPAHYREAIEQYFKRLAAGNEAP